MSKTEILQILDLIIASFQKQPNQFQLNISVSGTNVGVQAHNSSGNMTGMNISNYGSGIGHSSSLNIAEIQQSTSTQITEEVKNYIKNLQNIRTEIAQENPDKHTITKLVAVLAAMKISIPLVSDLIRFILNSLH